MIKIRQYFYLIAGAVAGLLPLLVAVGGLGSDQAASLTEILTQVGSLLGGGAAVTAGVVLGKQNKSGVLEQTSPLDAVVTNIPVVVEAAAKAQADLERLRGAAADAIGDLPVYGAAAQEAIEKYLPRF